MCGIIGIIGGEPVAPLLIDALKRLEYRGYDSAGVATLEHGVLSRRRAGGRLILVTDAKVAAAAAGQPLATLTLPTVPATVGPLVYAVPMQLIAYHTAVALGTDVDQPRNLAKSVTVE